MSFMAVRLTRAGDRPFVGRTRELTAAAEILADSERAGVALIGGESGLGKTRLVEEIIAGAPEQSVVVRGVAVPRATPIPFELSRSALDPATGRALDEQTGAVIGPVPPGPDRGVDAERADALLAHRVRAEAEAFRAIHDGPTIFVFEDVHWADPESLEVIDRLMVAGPLGASVLITYRPNALHPGHPTSSFLRRAERRSHVVQFRLEPLRREEVEEYLAAAGRSVDGPTVEHVHGRTGGNPLLLSELVAATAGDADLTAGLPWTLAEMLRPEIERLPQSERCVAEAVAVLGADVGFDLLAAAIDAEEDELLDRLRALVEQGILVESGPDRFGFRHDMVREAVADSLFTREHRRIHAAVHDALLAAGSDDVVALVAHANGAGRTKQAADAARDAATTAMAEARSHQAMAFAEQALLEHTDDIELLRVAVVAGWMTGQDRPALHHLERWEELVGVDPTARAEVLHFRVRLLWESGDSIGADRAAEELAALAEHLSNDVAKAQALADVAQHHMLSGRSDEAIAVADRAVEVAAVAGSGADGAARQARAERASAKQWNGEDQIAAVRELLTVAAEAEGAGDHVVASRALHNVPIQSPIIEPRSHIERMRRASQRAGLTCIATDSYRRSLLVVSEIEGDRDSYEPLLEAAMEDLNDQPEIKLLAAFFAIDSGRFDEARRLANGLAFHSGTAHFSPVWQTGTLALVDLELGDPEPARRWLSDRDSDHMANKFAMNAVLEYLTPLLNGGLETELRQLLQRPDVDCAGEPAYFAVLAELEGRLVDAEKLYAAALASGTRRSVHDEAEIHLGRARVAVGLGRPDRPHLEAAATRLARWPGRRQDLVEALLGEPSPIQSTSALTPREREVAQLVTRGLTNGGIADELFISTKTASVHVSNILSKLGMASRTEIAAWVAEGGLA